MPVDCVTAEIITSEQSSMRVNVLSEDHLPFCLYCL